MSASLSGLRRAVPADLGPVVALQQAAYAANRIVLGVEPLPLKADYAAILRDDEVWLAEDANGLTGVLVLQPRTDDLLIWSVAIDPRAQGTKLGNVLLGAAEDRARQLGRPIVRLYTGQKLTRNVAWYSRHGYLVERVEALADRTAVHMMKPLG
ncbi:GNAT family N-acetyltransferase [uncultured Alsobacter sp.]|uniref:GNAT family N-acetyltransferase n=1 Tax=uncultured Alsobacter sp. TaxID=1748258 RepID=UPI0025EBD289|nr:GNAT family N-acetyltransferase [uncultured Alsobacter sp.]